MGTAKISSTMRSLSSAFAMTKVLQMTDQSGFDLLAKLIVLTDRLNEAPHQLIPLILEQFMPTDSRFETGF